MAMAPAALAEAQRQAQAVTTALGGYGIFGVELFIKDDKVWFSEVSPRPHDTGMVTMISQNLTQFELHVRAILGLPLGATDALSPCAMLNLVGVAPDAAAVLAVPDAHLHWYGKAPRAGRKVGHVTVRAPDAATLAERVTTLERLIASS
jgi:phosphoribosylglycinamide formyltransferase 2